jgi:excisionase family DNA binding protein
MSTVLQDRTPVQARQADQPAIRIVDQMLSQAAFRSEQRPQLRGADGQAIDLPESIFQLLRQVVHILAQGDSVSIVAVHKELTTQQAADILNVSRPHLISLLEQGVISFSHTGKHRRVKFGDLIAYKRQRDESRRAELAELTRASEELGMYE